MGSGQGSFQHQNLSSCSRWQTVLRPGNYLTQPIEILMLRRIANDKSSPTRQESAARRADLRQRLFPEGVPTLWCPSLTHYNSDGAIDAARSAAHLGQLARKVNSFYE
jgi:hypothetical protein